MPDFDIDNAIAQAIKVIEESLEFLFQLSAATIRLAPRLRTQSKLLQNSWCSVVAGFTLKN
jgi:hypothetical protein